MDRRILRTKKAIRNALLSLLLKKNGEKITIKEIAALADVDRKTVYNYYTGVSDIIDEIENELIQSFEAEARLLVNSTEPKEYFKMIARLIEKDLDLYELLMKTYNSTFVEKVIVFLREWVEMALNYSGRYPAEKISLAAEFVTAGIYCAYRHWFASDRKQSLEEFSLELCELIIKGLPAYFAQ